MAFLVLCQAATAYPVLSDPSLRGAYVNSLATRRARHIDPDYLLIGDSLTAQGAPWGLRLGRDPFGAVMLAQPGSPTAMLTPLIDPERWGYRPRHVLLQSGTNDVRTADATPARFAAQQRHNVDLLLASGTRVVLTLIPPTADPQANLRTAAFNRALLAAVHGLPIVVVDLAPDLAPDGVLRRDYTTDGIHFTAAAYRLWAERLRAATRR